MIGKANSLKDLETRRHEILSQIHSTQITPLLQPISDTHVNQLRERGSSMSVQHGASYQRENVQQTSRKGNSVGSSQHLSSDLSQMEKAYSLLKKKIYVNPHKASDSKHMALSSTTMCVNPINFQCSSTQGSASPSLESVNNSRTTISQNMVEMRQSGKSSDNDWKSNQVLQHMTQDDDLQTDCEQEIGTYNQWSGIDWSNSDDEYIDQTISASSNGADLFDWFYKYNKLDDAQRFATSDGIDEFIPFDPPIVSKFGPISRAARCKLKNSDPVIVTADEAITQVTPVTAIAPTQRPYSVTMQAPSRYKIPGHKLVQSEVSTTAVQVTKVQPHTMWHQHLPYVNHLGAGCNLLQELNRLEQNVTGARSEDERLAYELQAIELKISMRTGKRPDPVEQPDISNIEPPVNSSLTHLSLSPRNQQEFNVFHMVVEAQLERGDELISKQQQEHNDRQLAEILVMEELKTKKRCDK